MADEADAGFIVFTLGSAIRVSSMPENLVKMFAKVFSRIPQQVFWKWETSDISMENLSHNVKILKWLPQQDLLGKISCTTDGVVVVVGHRNHISLEHNVIRRSRKCTTVHFARRSHWNSRNSLSWSTYPRNPIWKRPARV